MFERTPTCMNNTVRNHIWQTFNLSFSGQLLIGFSLKHWKPGCLPQINIIFHVPPSSVLVETQPAHLLLTGKPSCTSPLSKLHFSRQIHVLLGSIFHEFEFEAHELRERTAVLCAHCRTTVWDWIKFHPFRCFFFFSHFPQKPESVFAGENSLFVEFRLVL